MRRLYSRIYWHFLGLLVVVGAASAVVLATGWRVAFLRPWTLRLARHVAAQVGAQPDAAARAQLVRHLSDELDLDLTLRRADGTLELATGTELPALTSGEWDEVRRGATIVHRRRSWWIAAPVRDRKTGALVGALECFPMRRFTPGNLERPLLTVGLVLLLVGLVTAPLARRISRPVERLTEASRRLGGGELSYRVPQDPHPRRRHHRHHTDELGELTRAWNEMAERVEHLVRGQRELLANVSHELRSPLARIRVALELLPAEAAASGRLADVKLDLDELERLIDDVLTAARLDATGLPVHLDRVAVTPLLAQLAERAGLDPATKDHAVSVAPGTPELELSADGALLRRALWNLVENAAKYGAAPITLAAERAGDRVRFSVTDRGPGIPEAERGRVLDPFYRIDRARTPTPKGGFGLGLALARRIAEVHGGTITIAAAEDRLQTGCRVTLELPIQNPSAS